MIAFSSSEAHSQLDLSYERLVIAFWKPSFFMSNLGAELWMSHKFLQGKKSGVDGQWMANGKWPMSLEDEWLSNSLKLSACQYLCVYHPCMKGIPTSSYTKCQISQKVAGAGFILGFFWYCKSICHLWTLSINATANWCIREITQCGHDPRKATCVTPACHRVLLSRPDSALLSPAYDGIAHQISYQICEFCGFCGCQCRCKENANWLPVAKRRTKRHGISCMWPKNVDKCYTNCVNSSTSPLASPSVGVAELGKCHGTWFWGHDSSTYIYCVNTVIVVYRCSLLLVTACIFARKTSETVPTLQ